MKLCFTRHAWARVHGRLSLTAAELADILEADLAINIGAEAGTNRIHRLFFSAPDDMCFVAIEDHINGVVITVLPVDFHENIAWRVSEGAQREARNLLGLSGRTNARATAENRVIGVEPVKAPGATVFRITAYAYDIAGQLKALNLGSWPCAPYEASVERLLDDDEFFISLECRLASRGFERDQCEAIYVKVGNRKPTRISVTAVAYEAGGSEPQPSTSS